MYKRTSMYIYIDMYRYRYVRRLRIELSFAISRKEKKEGQRERDTQTYEIDRKRVCVLLFNVFRIDMRISSRHCHCSTRALGQSHFGLMMIDM